ncbi:MAG: hypothetical protein IPN67_17890 [Bacteroidales bacterium]|nr:hypothetical protein [Bacteroidales bacterium]
MKKLILFFVAIAFSLTQMLAQESTFQKGDKVLNLGIGFGGRYSGTGMTTSIPPLSASFEVGVKDGVLEKGSIGVGGMLAYSSHKYEYFGWGWKYTSIVIGARGTFHYPLVDKLDTYTGLFLGYDISTAKEYGTATGIDYNNSYGGLTYAWFAGARYYFSDKFAAFAELGVGVTILNVGVTLKF